MKERLPWVFSPVVQARRYTFVVGSWHHHILVLCDRVCFGRVYTLPCILYFLLNGSSTRDDDMKAGKEVCVAVIA